MARAPGSLPLRLSRTSGVDAGSIGFSDWGAIAPIVAPPSEQVDVPAPRGG